MGKLFKRKRHLHAYSSSQMLATLVELDLVALMQHSSIWLAVEPCTAWLLDMCCTGQMEGGPGTAHEVAAQLGLELSSPPQTATFAEFRGSDGPQVASAVQERHHQEGGGTQTGKRVCVEQSGQEWVNKPGLELRTAHKPGTPPQAVYEPCSETERKAPDSVQMPLGACAPQAGAVQGGPQQPKAVPHVHQPGQTYMQYPPEQQQHSQGQLQQPHLLLQPAQQQQSQNQEDHKRCQHPHHYQQQLQQQTESNQGMHLSANALCSVASGLGVGIGESRGGGSAGGIEDQRGEGHQQGGRGRGMDRGRGRGRGGRGVGAGYSLLELEPWRAAPHAFVSVRLTLEEGFFLQHVLGCLRVKVAEQHSEQACPDVGTGEARASRAPAASSGTGVGHQRPLQRTSLKVLNSEDLWQACSSIRASFPTSYVAYHQLKSKGWLPRSGLLYGTDFTLYQAHPSVAHSTFSVVIMPLLQGVTSSSNDGSIQPTTASLATNVMSDPSQGTPRNLDQAASGHQGTINSKGLAQAACSNRRLDWHDLQITARVVGTVAKKLLLLYLVELPSSPGLHTHHCLEHFAVEERLVRRWVPDATRD